MMSEVNLGSLVVGRLHEIYHWTSVIFDNFYQLQYRIPHLFFVIAANLLCLCVLKILWYYSQGYLHPRVIRNIGDKSLGI